MSTGAIFAIVFGVIGVLVLIIAVASIRIVAQSTAVIVERLGKYHRTMETGFRMIVPFIDRTSPPINLKEIVADFKPQPVITKDNVTMQIDTVVYFQITDPKLYRYGVERPMSAIENLTATTLRNIVGELELDETLTSRDTVNSKMRVILDEATDAWGIKINRVELKNILPPKDIQEAMEKQMRAERERREAILRAEGEKKSNILVAEGEKQAEILRAEARKIALITEAEGEANEGQKPNETKTEGDEKKPEGEKEKEPEGAPEQYEDFSAPEGLSYDEQFIGTFKDAAKQLHLSQEKAQYLLDKCAPVLAQRQVEQIKAVSDQWAERTKTDPEIGGENWARASSDIARVRDKFGINADGKMDSDIQEFMQTPIGNHPGLLKLLARVGRAFGEAGFPTGGKDSDGKIRPEDIYKLEQ